MTQDTVKLLIITGPVGVGKSSVADAMAEILEERGIAHAVVDMDYLRYAVPRPDNDPFHLQLGYRNLTSLWPNYREAGVRTLIIPTVVEKQADIDAIVQAIPGAKATVVRLTANLDTIHERLHERHGKRAKNNLIWHIDSAGVMEKQLQGSELEDFTVSTDAKSLIDVAEEVLERW